MRPKKAIRYLCPKCEAPYEEQGEAEECCQELIEPTEGFTCGECDDWYEDRDEAKECCR